jgi:hypothetical protein
MQYLVVFCIYSIVPLAFYFFDLPDHGWESWAWLIALTGIAVFIYRKFFPRDKKTE